MSSERLDNKLPSFSLAVEAVGELAKTTSFTEEVSDTSFIEYAEWNTGSRSTLELSEEVAHIANLGSKVRVRLVGDARYGVALILRSRNLFNTARFGFFLQHDGDDKLSIWYGPAQKPTSDCWPATTLFDEKTINEASSELSKALIEDLFKAASE